MGNDAERRQTEKSIRVSVSLPVDQHTALAEIAKENRASLAWVVRAAVDKYLSDKAPLFAPKG